MIPALVLATDPKASASLPAAPVGWEVDSYALSAVGRGAGESEIRLENLPEGAVLELLLENGQRLLVPAEDAARYLGGAVGRDEGSAGEIRVGASLRFGGSRVPTGASRDKFSAWALKALRVYKTGPAGMTALALAGSFQDHVLEHRLGLYRCATDEWKLEPVSRLPPGDGAMLLFIHGTASSTEGSFAGLWQKQNRREKLAELYGPRIYGFEHRSLTESPVENALALVKLLPQGARLHLVSHSRGGMVGELLCRAGRAQNDPISQEEISDFLAQAQSIGHRGCEADGARLKALSDELKERQISIERFVRVACPARGTTLAAGRLDRWASAMLNLLGKGVDLAASAVGAGAPASQAYAVAEQFLLAVVKERTDARILPGLEAMMPDSPLVALLNTPNAQVAGELRVIAGDFDGGGLLAWLGDCLSEAYYGSETDLVVNTPSMHGGVDRVAGIWRKFVTGPDVTHFSYFERDESAGPLMDSLAGKLPTDAGFEPMAGPSRETIARGGIKPLPKVDAPIVFLLPGIMGSNLGIGRDRIWFDPADLIAGKIARLDVADNGLSVNAVVTDGWLDRYFEGLSRHLAQTHEVRPFVYDWRLSIAQAAEDFGKALDDALAEAEKRKQPVRIVAHSLGGLVARLALKDRWDRFKALSNSRLLQLGTPNQGSHSMAAVLLGRDPFVQTIEHWLDWRHDMKEFLGIVSRYPGVLELLPWPGENGKATDGVDYFDPATWQGWFQGDKEADSRHGWQVPATLALARARALAEDLKSAPVDPEVSVYVAGSAETPVAIRLGDGTLEIATTPEGDGRVPWETGIPKGVRAWYVDAAHGDLARVEAAFPAYVELLQTGRTGSLPERPASRGVATPLFRPRPRTAVGLYPSGDEVLAAALGARVLPARQARPSSRARVEVVHGSLAGADTPIMIGTYAGDSLRGSAAFLDRRLDGRLGRCLDLGRYPDRPGEVAVIIHPDARHKPAGAIVVGLGALGVLSPGELRDTLQAGLLEYARIMIGSSSVEEDLKLEVATLLVGSGYGGVSVESGVVALFEALRATNHRLKASRTGTRVAVLRIFEAAEDRAVAAASVASRLALESRYRDDIRAPCGLTVGEGGYRRLTLPTDGDNGWRRVMITRLPASDGLGFTLIGDRARNEMNLEPSQQQAVDGLIADATGLAEDRPGLSRALFELLVPNAFKDAMGQMRGIVLGVDMAGAVYPWELMRDPAEPDEPPLAARIGVVRQLASPRGRRQVPIVAERRALVVGDTASGFAELLAAQAEGAAVARVLAGGGYEVNALRRPAAAEVFVNLFDGRYSVIHLAGHGVVGYGPNRYTGMVLGDGSFLTPAQVEKLRRVPELVFLNCCHLGSMKEDAEQNVGEGGWPLLSANLAKAFIEMGCKAVVAAGWAVDDAAARTFASRFYEEMLDGECFGEAVRAAREDAWRSHRAVNTWGAYQAYGDERYCFPETQRRQRQLPDYCFQGQLLSELDEISSRISGASDGERDSITRELDILEAAVRGRFFRDAEVREKLGILWADLKQYERAIAHYKAALAQEDARVTLRAMEQLANLEARRGEELGGAAGEKLVQSGQARLEQLLALAAPTVERLSLLASARKSHIRLCPRASAKKLDGLIRQMNDAYWQAAELSFQRNGEWDYYPLLNALEGMFLLAARGDRSAFGQRQARLPALLDQARVNADRRFEVDRSFFHALAPVECELVAVLWAGLDAGVPPPAHDMAVRVKEVIARLGSPREQNSVTGQLQFLADLLPAGSQARCTLEILIEEIGRA
ncbi:MAG: CHAT domain-containing protein [Rhodocyclaceae bacterium]|nr:CHAT domain-containing protein [Rhodocyclaceae bacterium]